MKLLTPVTILSLVLAAHSGTAADGLAPDGRRVTDPEELRRYGFAPDTILYIAPNAETIQRANGPGRDEILVRSGEEAATRRGRASAAAIAAHRRVQYRSFNGALLRPQSSDAQNSSEAPEYLGYHPIAQNANPTHFLQLSLPNKARLQGLRWWAFNQQQGDLEALNLRVFRQCLPAFSAGQPVVTLLAEAGTIGALGDQSAFIDLVPDEVVNNTTCTYSFAVGWAGEFTISEITFQRIRTQSLR